MDIFVTSINNVTSQVLEYVSTLGGDAQQQIDNKRNKDDNVFIGDVISVDASNIQRKLTTEQYVDTSVLNTKNQILGGAGPAYDTLVELQTEIVKRKPPLLGGNMEMLEIASWRPSRARSPKVLTPASFSFIAIS